MELTTKIAWACLALLHMMPALIVFSPALVEKVYGASPSGDIGILLVHRGALFLAVCLAAVFALFDPSSRRLASVVLIVSMIGFLLVYLRAGWPSGELRKIAHADLVGLFPLAWVGFQAWR